MQRGPLLMDGAFGTVLHSRGVPIDQSFDEVNLTNPALVAEIHRSYIDAGADLIETNTFGANRYKLGENGLQQKVDEINRAAVSVARRVISGAFKDVLLAGSIGPLGVRLAPLGRVSFSEAQEAFAEQIRALYSAEPEGVDLLIIETMSDVREIEAAVAAARSISDDLPIVAQMTFTRDDKTLLGYPPEAIATQLAAL
ncbi:MAG TPA: homocysteine S-methyltransferase family protein, partial [Promineifilum sp.]|nr:homocysteine S-methyltransferase family protein [Promineifilum sp.]